MLLRPIAAFTIAIALLLTGFHRPAFAAHPSKSASAKATSSKIRPRNLIDINHASLEELKMLPGIQDALAAKIVRNRPYANKTQLSSKGIVSATAYRQIRALIIAKQ
jgi:competence protein ComEA